MIEEMILRMVQQIGMANAVIVYAAKMADGTIRTVLRQSLGPYYVDFSKVIVFSDADGANARMETVNWPDLSGISAPDIQVSDQSAGDGARAFHLSQYPKDKPDKIIIEKVIVSGENDVWYDNVSLPIAVLAVTLHVGKNSKTYYLSPTTGNVLGEAPRAP